MTDHMLPHLLRSVTHLLPTAKWKDYNGWHLATTDTNTYAVAQLSDWPTVSASGLPKGCIPILLENVPVSSVPIPIGSWWLAGLGYKKMEGGKWTGQAKVSKYDGEACEPNCIACAFQTWSVPKF